MGVRKGVRTGAVSALRPQISWFRLHGILSIHVIATPMSGRVRSSSVIHDSLQSPSLREEKIFPDVMSINLADIWRTGAVKEFEQQFAALVDPQPVTG